MIPENADEKDSLILDLLRQNARMSYTEIGEQVGLSRVAVKNRVAALEAAHIIRGYHADIDDGTGRTEDGIMFYLMVDTVPDKYEATVERFKSEPMAVRIYRTSGSCTLCVFCLAPTAEDRRLFMKKISTSFEGITYCATRDVWEVVKE